jgi:hypothetical protein
MSTGLQGAIPSDPGIRGPLHPLRHRCPPSPHRSGYASVGRLAGSGASTLSVRGLFGNGPLETGLATRFRLRRLGGGLRSWLDARCTRASALYLTAPPSCGCFAGTINFPR